MPTPTTLDVLSPSFIGEDRITAVLDDTNLKPDANSIVKVNFDYASANVDGGVVLPIVITVQPPSDRGVGYIRKVFSNAPPASFTFRTRDAGQYFLLIKESGHNQWQGRLLFTAAGEEYSQILQNERV